MCQEQFSCLHGCCSLCWLTVSLYGTVMWFLGTFLLSVLFCDIVSMSCSYVFIDLNDPNLFHVLNPPEKLFHLDQSVQSTLVNLPLPFSSLLWVVLFISLFVKQFVLPAIPPYYSTLALVMCTQPWSSCCVV